MAITMALLANRFADDESSMQRLLRVIGSDQPAVGIAV